MLGMARTWALELAGDGITVNVVAPGPVRTDMFHEVVAAGSEKERALAAAVPVKRLGEAADVARAVAFFTSPGGLRHRAGAVRLRRDQRRQPDALMHRVLLSSAFA